MTTIKERQAEEEKALDILADRVSIKMMSMRFALAVAFRNGMAYQAWIEAKNGVDSK